MYEKPLGHRFPAVQFQQQEVEQNGQYRQGYQGQVNQAACFEVEEDDLRGKRFYHEEKEDKKLHDKGNHQQDDKCAVFLKVDVDFYRGAPQDNDAYQQEDDAEVDAEKQAPLTGSIVAIHELPDVIVVDAGLYGFVGNAKEVERIADEGKHGTGVDRAVVVDHPGSKPEGIEIGKVDGIDKALQTGDKTGMFGGCLTGEGEREVEIAVHVDGVVNPKAVHHETERLNKLRQCTLLTEVECR